MAAVLRIGLRKHQQLDIGRVAPERPERRDEIVDLIIRERQTELCIGRHQRATRRRGPVRCGHANLAHRLSRLRRKDRNRIWRREPGGFRHPVMNLCSEGKSACLDIGLLRGSKDRPHHRMDRLAQSAPPAAVQANPVLHTTFDADNATKSTVVSDVGRLTGPGRNRSRPGTHPDRQALTRNNAITDQAQLWFNLICQQALELLALSQCELALGPDPVTMTCRQTDDPGVMALKTFQQAIEPEFRERGCARDRQVTSHSVAIHRLDQRPPL